MKKRSERKEETFKCIAIGKDVKVEQYTSFTGSMGTNGEDVGILQKKNCKNYQCSYINTSTCPLEK